MRLSWAAHEDVLRVCMHENAHSGTSDAVMRMRIMTDVISVSETVKTSCYFSISIPFSYFWHIDTAVTIKHFRNDTSQYFQRENTLPQLTNSLLLKYAWQVFPIVIFGSRKDCFKCLAPFMCSVWHDYSNNPSVSVTPCNASAQQLHCVDSDVCFCHSVICIMIHRSVYVREKTPVEKSARRITSPSCAWSVDDAGKIFVL